MNIQPSQSRNPKYPALAAVAVAAAMSTAACEQPQRTAGVPLATPEQQEMLRMQREAARKQGEADRRLKELLQKRRAELRREGQRLGGKVPSKKRPEPQPKPEEKK